MTRRLFAAGFSLEAAGWNRDAAAETHEHEGYMRQAIEEGRKNTRAPFGAVIVDREKKQVVARGFNKASENPVWHGEIDAINHCAEHAPVDWKRLTLYTTAEPCPMCQSAIVWAGMPLVVYGTSVPTLTELGWGQIAIRAEQVAQAASFHHTGVVGGILEAECDALFRASPVSKHH